MWCFRCREGLREREASQWKPEVLEGRKEGVRGQQGEGVKVWRSLFLATERNQVSAANGKERRVWVQWHEAALSLSFYMIHMSQRVLEGLGVEGGRKQGTNKYEMPYMVHTDQMEHKRKCTAFSVSQFMQTYCKAEKEASTNRHHHDDEEHLQADYAPCRLD